MLSVQTNVSAISAQRHLGATSNALGTAMERLSSGFRINRAADDAAGLAVSEKLKAQIGGLNQASRNSQDGISMIQTAEGALDEVQSMMQRMRDLAVQAASDTNGQTERDNINLELGQLSKEINSISQRSKFNGQSLLSGSLVKSQVTTAVGYNTSNTELRVATAGNPNQVGTAATITAIDIGGAQSGRGFLITGNTSTNELTMTMTDMSKSGHVMTMKDANGKAWDVKQTISVTDIKDGAETLNFSNFGIKITLGAMGTDGTSSTALNIAAAFGTAGNSVENFSIDTTVGSGNATLQTGSMQGDETVVSFVNTSLAGGTQLTGQSALDTLAATLSNFSAAGTRDNAPGLITALDNALAYISSSRAVLGAAQNRLQHTIANLGTTAENLSASNARIRDVDVATESSNMAKNQVLEQAGVSVLAQANQLPQLALKLLG